MPSRFLFYMLCLAVWMDGWLADWLNDCYKHVQIQVSQENNHIWHEAKSILKQTNCLHVKQKQKSSQQLKCMLYVCSLNRRQLTVKSNLIKMSRSRASHCLYEYMHSAHKALACETLNSFSKLLDSKVSRFNVFTSQLYNFIEKIVAWCTWRRFGK